MNRKTLISHLESGSTLKRHHNPMGWRLHHHKAELPASERVREDTAEALVKDKMVTEVARTENSVLYSLVREVAEVGL